MKQPFKCKRCDKTEFKIEDLNGFGIGYQCTGCGYYHTLWFEEKDSNDNER